MESKDNSGNLPAAATGQKKMFDINLIKSYMQEKEESAGAVAGSNVPTAGTQP